MVTEQHYTITELSERWGLSTVTVARIFRNEPGVLKLQQPSLIRTRKRRARVTLRVPASVAERVHASLTR